ncbi:hypothetical protein CK503_12595 [Aliifodinibius salipaludis]|uniref:Uncharacterized protein n=1 Tax=Fodinibius salipaludis TaxID=2032627 RepID=A0A2A2G658_9BACT|nr:hypothetical protein [Aliifodinibius salipaludis]PAU93256.1 hypothetical protein CK503_12595 [Aliifodinibius salipaludis]
MNKVPTSVLVGLLILAAVGLLAGLYSGLVRLGLLSFATPLVSPIAHGPLMINGFLGTLIGLERAAALEKKWAYAAPVFLAASTILLLIGFPGPSNGALILGSVGLTFVMGYLYYLQPKIYHLIMALGAFSLLVGNLLFVAGTPIYSIVGWWAAFPMLTIFGERLELNRIMRPPKQAQHIFTMLILGWLASLSITHIDHTIGWRIASLLLIGIAGWLIKYDIARKTIKSVEWTKYSAICLLTGYGWLILAGLFGLRYDLPTAGPIYDGLLHMLFVGFVFSMIFAHASVIIPSLSGKLVPWHTYFYLPLILLHSFLLIRIAGDMMGLHQVRIIGSYGNVAAIILFLGGIMYQLTKEIFSQKSESISTKTQS